jgi:hypothetical protein
MLQLRLVWPLVRGLRHAANLGWPTRWLPTAAGHSLRCSCTILTVRSRTSGENWFVFSIAQSFKSLEPPQNGDYSVIDFSLVGPRRICAQSRAPDWRLNFGNC